MTNMIRMLHACSVSGGEQTWHERYTYVRYMPHVVVGRQTTNMLVLTGLRGFIDLYIRGRDYTYL